MQPLIRKATHVDLLYLIDADTKCHDNVWEKGQWENRLKAARVRIMCLQTRTIGFYSTFYMPGKAEIEKLAIKPTFRGKGYGTALIEHCKQAFRFNGFRELSLVVPEYRALGEEGLGDWLRAREFKATKVIPDYFSYMGEDDAGIEFVCPLLG